MCYINGVKVSLEEFIKYKREQKLIKDLTAAKLFYQPVKWSFNHTEWPIITVDGFGKWDAEPAEWGIIPPWIKSREEANVFKRKYLTYNAIGAELFEKRSYATPARKYRCLVPTTGFYEHRHVPQFGKKGQPLKTPFKVPYHISHKDGTLMFMAGIFSPWFDHQRDEWVKTFSICTTEAGSLLKVVHNSKERQPVILTPELAERWTDKDLTDEEILKIATFQFPNENLKANTVGKDFLLSLNPEEEIHYDNVPEIIL